MRIRMLQSISGAGFTCNRNEETDHFSQTEAVRLIEKGYAVPVAPPVERAVKTVAETRGPAENSEDGRPGGSRRKRK